MGLVSVVVPVYYNESSLSALKERLEAISKAHQSDAFEFIFVDDGSQDNSFAVLKQLAQRDPRVRAIRLSRNFGSDAAILAGLTQARGDCAAFIAADLQDPPETLNEMIGAWRGGAEVVLAVRRDRHGDPVATRLFAYIFNWLFKLLVFRDFSPQGVGFFLIDRRVLDVITRASEKNAHIIGLILWTGFRRAIVEYDRVEREHGKSRWTVGKKIKHFLDAFIAFSYLPLRIASTVGILLALAGAVYAFVVLAAHFSGSIPVEGWTALMIVVLLTSGTQLLMLGVIGEYLWRNFDATRQRPPFIVASTINCEPAVKLEISPITKPAALPPAELLKTEAR